MKTLLRILAAGCLASFLLIGLLGPCDLAAWQNAAALPAAATAPPTAEPPTTTNNNAGTAGTAADAAPLDGANGRSLAIENFRPKSRLTVPQHLLTQARFGAVDVHTHPSNRLSNSKELLNDFVRLMDEQQIAVCVSLDGVLGAKFEDHLRYVWADHKDRFVVFATIDFLGSGTPDNPQSWACNQPGFVRNVCEDLKQAKALGCSGLKLFKTFGLEVPKADGSLWAIDDPYWDPVWQQCAELGLVVLMHTADPSAFFEPIDATNERWEELHRHPEWSFFGPQFPSRAALHQARNAVWARHRKTTFIAAHLGNDGENLAETAAWLDENPNVYVEMAARIAELGRQPVSARKFVMQYQDRVMFGTDGPRHADRLKLHWRFLETEDEYFPYAESEFPPQGFWRIYGLNLPDDVLHKVYHANAEKIIPGVRERYAAWQKTRSGGR